jgi:hypothetical protein
MFAIKISKGIHHQQVHETPYHLIHPSLPDRIPSASITYWEYDKTTPNLSLRGIDNTNRLQRIIAVCSTRNQYACFFVSCLQMINGRWIPREIHWVSSCLAKLTENRHFNRNPYCEDLQSCFEESTFRKRSRPDGDTRDSDGDYVKLSGGASIRGLDMVQIRMSMQF